MNAPSCSAAAVPAMRGSIPTEPRSAPMSSVTDIAASSPLAIWGDEGGNLDLTGTGSKYFTVCSIITPGGGTITADILSLRHQLALDGIDLPDGFHATEDLQEVRNAVFALLSARDIRADASLF